MLKQVDLKTLEERRADARVIMLHKVIHCLVAISLPSYFEHASAMTNHSKNHPFPLRPIHTTATYYKFSFFPAAAKYWNQLIPCVVLCPLTNQF